MSGSDERSDALFDERCGMQNVWIAIDKYCGVQTVGIAVDKYCSAQTVGIPVDKRKRCTIRRAIRRAVWRVNRRDSPRSAEVIGDPICY